MVNEPADSPKVFGPAEVIGDWDYFSDQNGDLYRAQHVLPNESRSIQFVVPRAKSRFVLRIARIAAGLPQHGAR